jgi:hypothetical protein
VPALVTADPDPLTLVRPQVAACQSSRQRQRNRSSHRDGLRRSGFGGRLVRRSLLRWLEVLELDPTIAHVHTQRTDEAGNDSVACFMLPLVCRD